MTLHKGREDNVAQQADTKALTGLIRSESKQERFGKVFELGNPYVNEAGLVYCWPGNSKDSYESICNAKIEGAGKFLLERAREYIDDFGGYTHKVAYPYLQAGDKSLAIHIGDGGRWIELGYYFGDGMGAFQNLKGYDEQILGFNLTSDFL